MNQFDYFYDSKVLTANFADNELDFDFSATELKIATTTSVDFSFDGVNIHGQLVSADGLQHFPRMNKGKIWIKGVGTCRVFAWVKE